MWFKANPKRVAGAGQLPYIWQFYRCNHVGTMHSLPMRAKGVQGRQQHIGILKSLLAARSAASGGCKASGARGAAIRNCLSNRQAILTSPRGVMGMAIVRGDHHEGHLGGSWVGQRAEAAGARTPMVSTETPMVSKIVAGRTPMESTETPMVSKIVAGRTPMESKTVE